MSKKILGYLTIFVLIFFEVYAGIRLLTNPIDFTSSVVYLFGIIMLVVGVFSVIRALQVKAKSNLPYRLGLFGGILDLIVGALWPIAPWMPPTAMPILKSKPLPTAWWLPSGTCCPAA